MKIIYVLKLRINTSEICDPRGALSTEAVKKVTRKSG